MREMIVEFLVMEQDSVIVVIGTDQMLERSVPLVLGGFVVQPFHWREPGEVPGGRAIR